MTEASLEELRSRNIQRNKDLLKKLNLDSINDSIFKDAKFNHGTRQKTPTSRVSKKELPLPTRRSRRLRSNPEDQEEVRKQEEEEERAREEQEKLKELRLTKLSGEFSLYDLLTDKLGYLRDENGVLNIQRNEKLEQISSSDSIGVDAADNLALKELQIIGERCSTDASPDMIQAKLGDREKQLDKPHVELDKLTISARFEPSSFKLSHQRITSLHFHPSVQNRLVCAGDTSGSLGIWAVDSSTEEGDPLVLIFKPHGRSVSKICEVPNSLNQVVSASYDGSARIMDLQKQISYDVLTLKNSDDETIALSDLNIHPNSPQIMSVTTLEGHFYQADLRAPKPNIRYQQLLRIHDKKVGGFSINPNREYQFASSSLDRTFRIWDLRSISKKNSTSVLTDGLAAPHLYGGFSSRLSISTVDWNSENRLVCNGYDDYLHMFDLSGSHGDIPDANSWAQTYMAGKQRRNGETDIFNSIPKFASIRHNCQTGRWVSILKARWQKNPADGCQKFVIANMNRNLDIYDQEGKSLCSLLSPDVTAIPAVSTIHASQNWVIGGTSSGKVYLFD